MRKEYSKGSGSLNEIQIEEIYLEMINSAYSRTRQGLKTTCQNEILIMPKGVLTKKSVSIEELNFILGPCQGFKRNKYFKSVKKCFLKKISKYLPKNIRRENPLCLKGLSYLKILERKNFQQKSDSA